MSPVTGGGAGGVGGGLSVCETREGQGVEQGASQSAGPIQASSQLYRGGGELIMTLVSSTDESFMCLTKHEPVGVCGAIIPVSPDQYLP